MIPKIIHQSTTTKTWEEFHLIARAKRIMPDFKHILWEQEENISLLEQVFPQHVDAYLSFDRMVVRFDVSRCLYMYLQGGIYCDTDYMFYKSLDVILDHKCVLGIEEQDNKGVGGGYKVGNAFLASEAGLALWPEFIESIFYRHGKGESRVVFLSGPHALSLFLKSRPEYERLVTFLPPEVIYPDRHFLGLAGIRKEATLGAHLCWGSWRKKSLAHRARSRVRRCISALL